MSQVELIVDGVAEELEWLPMEPVFVGGAVIGLYLDDFGRSQIRPTDDVHCIVHVVTRADWWDLEKQLRTHHWSPDPDGPVCRYLSRRGVKVDLMPVDPSVLGFAGQWYPAVVETAEQRKLSTGRRILVPNVALLVACKLEAFGDRGMADPHMSEDLEDVVALLDGCGELEACVVAAAEGARAYVAEELVRLLDDPALLEVVTAQLPPAGDPSAQETRVLALMKRLADLGTRRGRGR
jgi:hypothetical protein